MSEGDIWAVHEPRATGGVGDVGDAGNGTGPQFAPGAVPERPLGPDFVAWLTAGLLFLAAGVLQAVTLLIRAREVSATGTGTEPLYEALVFDLEFGIAAVGMLAGGALLLIRRAREVAGGFAVAFGLATLTGYSWQLRPSKIKPLLGEHGSWLLVGAYAMLAVGTVTVLVVMLRRRRERAVEQRTKAERRADRVVVVPLAFVGAVVGWIASALAAYRFSVGVAAGGGLQSTFECCSFSQGDGWKQASILVAGATIVVLALFAATARSRSRAAGLLFGVVVATLPSFAVAVAVQVAPLPTLYGIHYRQAFPDTVAAGSSTPGFWLALVALLLLSSAAVTRLALGSRKAAYPQNELQRIAS